MNENNDNTLDTIPFAAEIARLCLKEDDILLVGLDFGNLPKPRAADYAAHVAAGLSKHISNDIIIVRKGTEITILDTTGDNDEKERT